MNKKLITSVALGCMLSMAGTAMAANHNFDDVPRTDWSYGAITQLLEKGAIDTYDDTTFNGQKIVTRYEMALIIRRAKAKETNNIETNAIIDKLASEYKIELKALSNGDLEDQKASDDTETNQKKDAIDWSGSNFRIRYDYNRKATSAGTTSSPQGKKDANYNFELIGRSQFAPGWNAEVHLEGNKDASGKDTAAADNLSGQFDIEQMFVTGPVGSGTLQIGRFKNSLIFGNVNKEFATGVRYTFGKVLKTGITYVKNDSKYAEVSSATVTDSASTSSTYSTGESSLNPGYGTSLATIDLRYPLDKNTNLFSAFYFTDSYNASYKKGFIWELAMQKTLQNDLALYLDYAQSNRNSDNHMAYVALSYKKADIAKVGSYSWTFEAIRNEAKATIKTNEDIKDYGYASASMVNGAWLTNNGETLSAFTNGQKGWDIVYQYVPVKNMKLTARYLYGVPINSADNAYNNKQQLRMQMEVFF